MNATGEDDTAKTYASDRRDAQENHQRILRAALEVFAEDVDGAEMRHVAARAGVGVGTLYRHYSNREALLNAVLEHALDDVLDGLDASTLNDPPEVAFHRFVVTGTDCIRRFGKLMPLLMQQNQLRPNPKTKHHIDQVLGIILERGIASGAFRADADADLVTASLEAMFASGKMLQLAQERGFERAADDVAEFFLKHTLRAK